MRMSKIDEKLRLVEDMIDVARGGAVGGLREFIGADSVCGDPIISNFCVCRSKRHGPLGQREDEVVEIEIHIF